MVLYGRNPRVIPDSPRTTSFTNPAAADFAKTMTRIHQETEKALTEAAGRMKAQYDKRKRPARGFQIGERVWLDSTNLSLPCPKKKLDDKRVGPFEVIEKASAAAYKLKLPPQLENPSPIQRETPNPVRTAPHSLIRNCPPPPPPDLINDEEEFEIEEVLDSRPRTKRGRKGKKSTKTIDYFVKWKGWTREHNSWVRDEEMGNAQEAIEEYEERTNSVRRLDATEIVTRTYRNIAMILDHKYNDHGDVGYLGQWPDGSQKWVVPPKAYCFEWLDHVKNLLGKRLKRRRTPRLGTTRTLTYENLQAVGTPCLNEGVMLRFIPFFLILSYLGTSAGHA